MKLIDNLSIKKLEEMIDSADWKIVAKSKFIDNEVVLTDRNLLREYLFCVDYNIYYEINKNNSTL